MDNNVKQLLIREIEVNSNPNLPGVYIVCLELTKLKHIHILYIGSSKNTSKRVNHPNHPFRKAYDRYTDINQLVYLRFIPTILYKQIEKELIFELKPIWNKNHKHNG